MKRTILTFLILFQFNLFAQDVIRVELDGHHVVTEQLSGFEATYLTFNDAVNKFEFGALPLYKTIIELPHELYECQVDIKAVSYDTLSAELLNVLTDSDLITDELQSMVTHREREASVYVQPLILFEDKLLRLQSYEIIPTFVPTEYEVEKTISSSNYTSESVLASGRWIKMGITTTGIHKLTYNDISNMGLSPDNMDINRIGIFGNYNGMLPEANNKARLDDLQENSIFPVGLNDGKFDSEDYLLFYAQAPVTWEYNPFTGRYMHDNNFFTDTTYYFFTPDKGSLKTLETIDENNLTPTYLVESFIDYNVHEVDAENMISSGKKWYGERFEGDTTIREFIFNFPI